MRLRLLALAGVLAAFLVVIGTAAADSGTFSGSITPTDCGPLHPVTVAPGDTTVVAMAAETVSANARASGRFAARRAAAAPRAPRRSAARPSAARATSRRGAGGRSPRGRSSPRGRRPSGRPRPLAARVAPRPPVRRARGAQSSAPTPAGAARRAREQQYSAGSRSKASWSAVVPQVARGQLVERPRVTDLVLRDRREGNVLLQERRNPGPLRVAPAEDQLVVSDLEQQGLAHVPPSASPSADTRPRGGSCGSARRRTPRSA